jgi:hypothetical protein
MPWPGDIVHVWERKGLFINTNGELSVSETKHTKGSVDPADELQILDREPARSSDHFWVRRLHDGLEFRISPNHYDPGTAHSRNKGTTKQQELAYLQQRLADRMAKP